MRRAGLAPLLILTAGGLIVRLIVLAAGHAGGTSGHPIDIGCFYAWADMMFQGGFRNFYVTDAFTDYPPGYMYVLYLLGWIRDLFNISFDSLGHNILIKMPAMLADLGIGAVLYSMARNLGGRKAFTVGALYIFNPLVIMLSAAWGQVDSVFMLLLLLSLYLLYRGKDLKSYLLYAVAILVKPQALMFGPVFLVLGVMRIVKSDSIKAEFRNFPVRCLLALALIIAAMLPFGMGPVLDQMARTIFDRYPFVSVNAYNIYVLFGLNWHDVFDTFLGVSFSAWGVIAMGAAAVIGGALVTLKKEGWSLFYSAAAICAFVYTFATRMHERYSFPIFVLLLAAYAFRPDKKILAAWGAMLVPAFLNNLDVLRGSLVDIYHFFTFESRVYALLWVLSFVFFAAITILIYRDRGTRECPED